MSVKLVEVDRESLEDESQGISLSKSRKVKDRWTLTKKKRNGKSTSPLCVTCRKNDGIVKRAHYKDSYGIKSLCGGHARDNGTHSVQNACIVCGLTGHWRNEEGYHCAKHAREAGIYMPLKWQTCVNDNKNCLLYTSPSPRDRG